MADLKSPSRFSIRGIYNSLTSESPAAPAPPPPSAPKQAASQPSAISGYAGMTALQRREKEAGLKDGGQMKDGASGTVPGKGKGDKIKAKYEPGEFVVSNAMLAANPGLEQFLSELRNKALASQGKSPEDTVAGSFKGGVIHALNGMDPNEAEKRLQRNSFGDAVAAATDPGVTQLKVGKPGDFPMNPDGTLMQPAVKPAAIPATSNVPMDATAVSDRQTASRVWGGIKDANSRAGAAIADVAMMVPRGLVGAYDSAVVRPMRAAGINAAYLSPNLVPAGSDPSSMTPFYDKFRTADAAAPVAPAAPSQPNVRTDVQRGGAIASLAAPKPAAAPVASPTANPATVQPAVQAGAPTSVDGVTRIDRPGQSPMFTNLSASDPSNQSLAARGAPSAQNVAAANNLSQNYATAPVVPTQDNSSYEPATIRHSGNDWRSANDLRNLEVSASSITNKHGGRNGASPAVVAYYKALERDNALKRGDNQDVISRNKDGAANERAGILERGAISRTAMQEAGANSRAVMTNQVASQRAGAEISKMAAETQALNQLQTLREQLINEKDPAKQASLSEKMQVIMGKYQRPEPVARDVYGAIAGGVDAMGNKTDPIIYNKQTGERAGAQSRPPYPEGTKLTGPDKKPYIVKNGVPVPA